MSDVKTYALNIPEEPPAGTHVQASDVGGTNLTFVRQAGSTLDMWFPINGGMGRTWEELLLSFGELTDVTPLRTFELPPEPPVSTKVRDRDGDLWERFGDGWGVTDQRNGRERWVHVMTYAPLNEVR